MSLQTLYDDANAIYHFNNGWTDAKGNHDIANTGALFDNSYPKLGPYNGIWDGNNDFGGIPNHSDYSQDEFSLSIWMYQPNLLGVQNFLGNPSAPLGDGWLIAFNGGSVYFQGGDGGAWPAYQVSYALSVGWNHVITNHSLTSHDLIVNGYLRASVAGGTMSPSSKPFWFGRDTFSGAYYPSQLDEGNYFTRVITDGGVSVGQLAGGEAAELWNGGAGVELSLILGNPHYYYLQQRLAKED